MRGREEECCCCTLASSYCRFVFLTSSSSSREDIRASVISDVASFRFFSKVPICALSVRSSFPSSLLLTSNSCASTRATRKHSQLLHHIYSPTRHMSGAYSNNLNNRCERDGRDLTLRRARSELSCSRKSPSMESTSGLDMPLVGVRGGSASTQALLRCER